MPSRTAAAFLFISGSAALVYEVLWSRDLAYLFGSSAQALAAVVAAFLAGLALGAWVAGRRVRPRPGLLRVYALLEAAIGITAPLVPWLVGVADRALLDPCWPWLASHDLDLAARFLVAFVVMLLPTACMGATLPVLCSAFAAAGTKAGDLVGRLYGWNTLGGVVGCLAAGFFLVEQVGLWKSRCLAAVVNLLLCAWAWRFDRRLAAGAEAPAEPAPLPAAASAPRGLVLGALLASSAISIALELCWTRLVALAIGGTTYAFSLVLALYLLGLGGGSLLYAALARRGRDAVRVVAGAQLLLGLFLLAVHGGVDTAMGQVGEVLYARTAEALGSEAGSPLFWRGGLGLLLAGGLVLLPALWLGIAFPALSDLEIRARGRIGAGIGVAYLFSTAGGVAASLLTTFVLLPWLGIERMLVVSGLATALLGVLLVAGRRQRSARDLALFGSALVAALVVAGADAMLLRWEPRRVYGGVGLYGRKALSPERKLLAVTDGPACSVAVFETRIGGDAKPERALTVNGKVDASTRGDMGTQLLLAWLPELFHPDPHEVFVLGYGAGVTTAAAARYGARVLCAEIEPAVLAASPFFADVNRAAHQDPQVTLVVEDGRAALRRSGQRYDVITTEPSNPWLAGMAALFTVEFYELCKARLTPDGVLCQWVQLYWSAREDYRSIVATLATVFPHLAIYRTTFGDTLLLASMRPLALDWVRLEERAATRPWLVPELAAAARTAGGGGGGSEGGGSGDAPTRLAAQLATMVVLQGADVQSYVAGESRAIRDDVPFLEFSAARRMHANSTPEILQELLQFRSEPVYGSDGLAALLSSSETARVEQNVGADLVRRGRADLAEAAFTAAAARAADLERLPFWRWLAARRLGKTDLAAERLAELERKSPPLLLQVADELTRSGDTATAGAVLDRLEQRVGAAAGIEVERGRLYEAQMRPLDAARAYERALRLDAGQAAAREGLKRLRESRGAASRE